MAKKDELEKKEEVAVDTTPKSNILVEDVQVLKPRELPLVVKPASGAWANEAQEEYARTLNGYAYKNPTKWAKKKAVLLVQLENLATDPEGIVKLRGANTKLTFGNKLIAS